MSMLYKCATASLASAGNNPNNAIFAKGVLPATTDTTNYTEVDLGFVPDLLICRTHKSSTSGITCMFDNSLGETTSLAYGASAAGTSYNGTDNTDILRINNGFKIKPNSTTSTWYNTPIYYYAVKYI